MIWYCEFCGRPIYDSDTGKVYCSHSKSFHLGKNIGLCHCHWSAIPTQRDEDMPPQSFYDEWRKSQGIPLEKERKKGKKNGKKKRNH